MYTAIETYIASRIISEALDYMTVVTKRPDLKTGIDVYLTDKGRADLITVQ